MDVINKPMLFGIGSQKSERRNSTVGSEQRAVKMKSSTKDGMEWQLLIACFFLISLSGNTMLYAQSSDTTKQKKPIDVNFLFSYYQQDGEHSAVTGGEGTQELSDKSVKLNLIIPVDTSGNLTFGLNLNHYTSASTDKIDNRISSASASDVRTAWQLGWEQTYSSYQRAYSFSFGGSVESDYISTNFQGSWYTPLTPNKQHSFLIDGQVFLDRWVLYFPSELRDTIHPFITTDRRFSYHLSLQYEWIINRRLALGINSGISLQKGLISTPFHRVYFEEEELPRIEYLPDTKWKWPLGIRVHYFWGSGLVSRAFYRYYLDNFGIRAHTASLELAIKLNPRLTLSPIYRYHTQSASKYFAGFEQHSVDANYYTSDYDLSAFHSHKIGIGFRLLPYWQWHWKRIKWYGNLKSIGIRIVYYKRSDGLWAWTLTTAFGGS